VRSHLSGRCLVTEDPSLVDTHFVTERTAPARVKDHCVDPIDALTGKRLLKRGCFQHFRALAYSTSVRERVAHIACGLRGSLQRFGEFL
jgi:hypothetical protein